MKNSKLWLSIGISIVAISVSAQQDFNSEVNNINLSYSKTTSIVFPYAIKSVDKGSAEILVQKAKGVENILFLKAGRQNFAQTNLTVVTADGKVYGFILNFDQLCPTLHLKAELVSNFNTEALFSSENENQKQIRHYAELALSKIKKVSGLHSNKFSVDLRVNGIFIHHDMMYFRVRLANNSRINYDLDQLRFFIRDQNKSKRTAVQELEIVPVFCSSVLSTIKDHSEITLVFAIPKFTIAERKLLSVELTEKNAGRHLELNIKNTDLMNLEIL